MIKQVAIIAAAMLSTSAFAAKICEAGTGSTFTGDPAKFVRIDFKPKCSANSIVMIDHNATSAWVSAGSTKGANTFIGTTTGGGVKKSQACASKDGCVESDVTTALTAAAALGSGS